jgi:hypothetical protein
MLKNPARGKIFQVRYEDFTREERAQLLLSHPAKYMALVGPDQLLLILDGVAKSDPYKVPPREREETWRKLLKLQALE